MSKNSRSLFPSLVMPFLALSFIVEAFAAHSADSTGSARSPQAGSNVTGQAAVPGPTPTDHSRKTENKAAFLFNLAGFVDWQDPKVGAEGSPVIFAVMEDDSLGPALKQMLEAKGLNGQVLVIRDENQVRMAREFFNVFSFNTQNPVTTAKILKNLKGSRVLTVSEAEDFLKQGGMVQVEMAQDTLQFKVSEASLNSEGLKAKPPLKKLEGTPIPLSRTDQQQVYETWKKAFDEAVAVGSGLPMPQPAEDTSIWSRALAALKWVAILAAVAAIFAGWRLMKGRRRSRGRRD